MFIAIWNENFHYLLFNYLSFTVKVSIKEILKKPYSNNSFQKWYKSFIDKSKGSDIIEEILVESPWTRVCVGTTNGYIPLVIQISIFALQTFDNLQPTSFQ